MKLRKIGGVWYMDAMTATGRVRRSTGETNRARAERRAYGLLDARLNADPWTLAEAVDCCMAGRWAGLRSERTQRARIASAVTHFGGARRVDTIDLEALDGYVASLRGLKASTINRKLSALKVVLDAARERGHGGPVVSMPRLKEGPGRSRWLSEAEEANLLRHLDPAVADLVVFMLDTGLRISEALRASWSDVLPGGLWVAPGKTDKARLVPLTSRAERSLEWHGWVGLTKGSLRHALARGCAQAGLEGVSWHTLRHTCASRLAQRGVHIKVAQQFLGHSSLESTLGYSHMAGGLGSAVEALEARPSARLKAV